LMEEEIRKLKEDVTYYKNLYDGGRDDVERLYRKLEAEIEAHKQTMIELSITRAKLSTALEN
jgi:hypothetical protein